MITKAIIPLAGTATRHLPLSKAFPKEFFPLADKPLLHYALEELKAAGAKELVFVVSAQKRIIGDYLKKTPPLEKELKEKKQEDLLEYLLEIEKLASGFTFSFVSDKPLGDGHALLQAKKIIGEEPCFVLYPDDVIQARTPCLVQLAQVFRTAEKPIVGLLEVPIEQVFSYMVAVERIATRIYKIKNIIEKSTKQTFSSRLAWRGIGRSILTPDVFEYLKKAKPNKTSGISLMDTFVKMLKDGKVIYGYECEGRWWDCGNKEEWMKAFVYFAAKHPHYGKEVRRFIKEV